MIDRNHPLPLTRQALALSISRGSFYYPRQHAPKENPNTDNCIKQLHRKHPKLGSRALCELLNHGGVKVTRHRVHKVIKAIAIEHAKSTLMERKIDVRECDNSR